MYYNGKLKQVISCASDDMQSVEEFLQKLNVDFISLDNKLILLDIEILFTYDGYSIDDLLKLLTVRYTK